LDGAVRQTHGPVAQRRVLIVHNPVAGWRRSARVARVRQELEALGCTVRMEATDHAGHAEQMLRSLRPGLFDVVAISGGDGTINEAINGLGAEAPVLAVIPNGTANVLAQEIGLPEHPTQIARLIAEGEPATIYTGTANGRRFAMMAGVGFDAHVVAAVTPKLKRRLGKAAYVWRSLTLSRHFDYLPYRVRIDGTDAVAMSAIAANGRFYAGRHLCAPEARLDRPGFHVCLFARGGAYNVIRYGAALLVDRLPTLPDFEIRRATSVDIEGQTGEPVQADGKIVATLPVRIRTVDAPIRILRPHESADVSPDGRR